VLGLLLVGVVAGFLAGISPCILPVLPVVLVAGASAVARSGRSHAAAPSAMAAVPTAVPSGGAVPSGSAESGGAAALASPEPGSWDAPAGRGLSNVLRSRAGLARPLAVVGGLILSFSLLLLVGSEFLSLLHLPADSLRDAGIALLALVGLGYLVPPLGILLERPFARVRARRPTGTGRMGGFVLGLALGVLYVPCAGPILAAITVLGATHRVGWTAVFLTAAFAVGTGVPLFVVAVAGGQLTGRLGALRRNAQAAPPGAGTEAGH
jgi:cytochrome c biogenesis protein CcdA